MKTFITIIAILFFQQPAIFSKLTGTWQMQTKRGMIYEQWDAAGEGKISGRSYRLNNADTVILERVAITAEGKDLYYTAVVTGQNNQQPVRFKLSNTIGNYYVFENKEHDYPQRVIYEFVNADSIHARIEGTKDGKNMFSDFFYSRKK